ncbi:MAG: histidine phosphatase family protein [Bacteroidota bacterium]
MKYFFFYACIALSSCKTTTYYIVRHAEKEAATSMVTDVPLTAAGTQRAAALKDSLDNKVSNLFSTDFVRTRSTAAPLVIAGTRDLVIYSPVDTGFVTRLKAMNKKGILIVGHSNTVDNLVNELLGRTELSDLPETQYGDLFIVKKKKGNYTFSRSRFGN